MQITVQVITHCVVFYLETGCTEERNGKMEFYQVIEKRRTVRDFENEIIPDETVERIIAA